MRKLLDLYRQMRDHSRNHDDRTQWAFMKVFWIYNDDGSEYLKRWRIFQCPAFALYVHKIVSADPQPDIHDHPFPFAAFILKGGYIERYAEYTGSVLTAFLNSPDVERMTEIGSVMEYRVHRPGSFNSIGPTAAHSIMEHLDGTTWTLVFVGPRIRKWGFWTKDGFKTWDEYDYKADESGQGAHANTPKAGS